MPAERTSEMAEARREKVFAMLSEAAASGQPCPTNPEIVEYAGYGHPSSASQAILAMCQRGLIRKYGHGEYRIIEIVSTGERTASRRPAEAPRCVIIKRPVREIVAIVARTAGLTPADITGRKRMRIYIRPRVLACHFALREGWSSAAVGRVVGGRDHSTILHAARLVEPLLRTDKLFARLMARTQDELDGKPAPLVTIMPAQVDVPRRRPVVTARHPIEIDETDSQQVRARDETIYGSARLLRAMNRHHPERVAA